MHERIIYTIHFGEFLQSRFLMDSNKSWYCQQFIATEFNDAIITMFHNAMTSLFMRRWKCLLEFSQALLFNYCTTDHSKLSSHLKSYAAFELVSGISQVRMAFLHLVHTAHEVGGACTPPCSSFVIQWVSVLDGDLMSLQKLEKYLS